MVIVPAATPKEIVTRLHVELKSIIGSPEIQEQILKLGMLPAANSSREELQPFINSEIQRWGKIVRQVGLAGTQ
jgi:tripartite-type tricarboxylate transporter receptor subunit TctC